MLYERADIVKILYAEQHFYTEDVRSLHEKLTAASHGPVVSYFRELQQKGVLRDFDPDFGARILFGMIFFLFQEQMYFPSKDPLDWDKIIRDYVDIFARGTER